MVLVLKCLLPTVTVILVLVSSNLPSTVMPVPSSALKSTTSAFFTAVAFWLSEVETTQPKFFASATVNTLLSLEPSKFAKPLIASLYAGDFSPAVWSS